MVLLEIFGEAGKTFDNGMIGFAEFIICFLIFIGIPFAFINSELFKNKKK